ncbi:DUF6531 domain-containing protein, partial [Streptomyces thermolineatus]|uniref:DUF6531 domain-containing protein n=1 Tax=Streptomyces thermolineatus TaxID=44033 RepID=UPI0031D01420
ANNIADGLLDGLKKAADTATGHIKGDMRRGLKQMADNHRDNDTKLKNHLDGITNGTGKTDTKSPNSSGTNNPGNGSPSGRPNGPGGNGKPNASGGRPSSMRDGARDPNATSTPAKDRECKSDPVDVVTGEMILAQTDIALPGLLPLVLERTHVSSYRCGHWFGRTWASTLDERLELDEHGAVLATADGMLLTYPAPRNGEPVLPERGPQWLLSRHPAEPGVLTVHDPHTGLTRSFAPPAPGQHPTGPAFQLPLESIEDRNGHRIDLVRDTDGVLMEVTHTGGYRIAVDTHPALPRVTALRLLDPTDPHSPGTTVLTYGYDEAGNLTGITNSSGLPLRLTYDADGRITSWTDRNDSTYTYTYDAAGRVVRTTGPDGYMSGTFTYDEARRTTVHTDSLGHPTTHRYNTAGKVTTETDPLGHTTRTEYDPTGRHVTAVTDPLGHTTRYTRDTAGNVTAVELPDGTRATATYNRLNLPVEITEPGGATSRYTYDERGNRLTATDPAGTTTRYTYDEHGRPTAVTDALGHTRRITADAAGLPVAATDPLGNTTTVERDAFGRPVSLTEPLGRTTRTGWTVEGKPTWRQAADGTRETWEWDGEGNLLAHTDPAGNTTRCTATHFDRIASRTDPDGNRYDFAYDTELRLTAVTNPQGLTWSYTYDPAGRLVAETDFNGRTLTYTHDAAGRLTTRTNGADERVEFLRDAAGRILGKRSSDGTETRFSYDVAGRLVGAANDDAELLLERDAAGRVQAESVNGRTCFHTYDPLGRRVSRTTPAGHTSVWTYAAGSRPLSLRSGDRTLHFSHDEAGRETALLLGDEVRIDQAWDGLGRLAEQSITAGSGHLARTLQHRSYTYRADGRITRIHEQDSGTRRFELDRAGRVTAVHARDWTESYAYDQVGNLVRASAPGLSAEEDREFSGTLVRRAGRTAYEYDAQGRTVRVAKRLLNGQSRTWGYTWNAEDRLVGVVTPSGDRWRYLYDPMGRRIAKQRLDEDGSVIEQTDFTWDGSRLAEQVTGAHATTWDHVPGTHRAVAQSDRTLGDGTGARFHAVVSDPVGTPLELVSPEGEIGWRARRTLWGLPLPSAPNTVDCPLRFPGQYHDAETGLAYNFHRYYDPGTARYLSPDPLGLAPALNHHGYVPNPFSWSDPLGLAPCTVDPTISEKAMNHVLHGDINEDGEFGGWHLHPGSEPERWPENRYVKGNLVENPDGSVNVAGEVGALDTDWSPIPKKSIGHTFFPESWTEADVRAAGDHLFRNGEYSHGNNRVSGTYNGVEMIGFLEKGGDGKYRPSTFFPTGG